MGSLCVKFHDDRCKGKVSYANWAILRNRASTDGRMDERTDGQGDSSVPPLTSLREV